MTFLIIILITIALWLIFAPYIRPWLQRRAQQKMADFLRRQMGMPTEKEQRRAEKEAERREEHERRHGVWSRPPRKANTDMRTGRKPIIPAEYAEDVEFVEIREFRQRSILEEDEASRKHRRHTVITESQVSDVEYTEIRN